MAVPGSRIAASNGTEAGLGFLLPGTFLDLLGQELLVLLDVLLGLVAELLPAAVAADVIGLALVGHRRQRRPKADHAERANLATVGDQRLAFLGAADQVDLAEQGPVLGLHLVLVQV